MLLWVGYARYDLMDILDRGAVDVKRRDVDQLMNTAVKHYMRRHVWLPVAMERQRRVERPINYFTLTTPDLLDVKLLEDEGLIARSPRGYPTVGFCEFDDKSFDSIIRSLGRCRWSYKGGFEQMVHEHDDFESRFGFDVINLDFIAVPFPDGESPLEGTWGAIEKLLLTQWNNALSFDLFLTFRGSATGTSDEALDRVADLLNQNLRSGRGNSEFQSRVGHCNPFLLMREDYVTFLCLGLPKLLAGTALDIGFSMPRMDVYTYPRTGGTEQYSIVKFVASLEVPSQGSNRQFAMLPQTVANYETMVPLIFSNPVTDVGDILDEKPGMAAILSEDLDRLVGL